MVCTYVRRGTAAGGTCGWFPLSRHTSSVADLVQTSPDLFLKRPHAKELLKHRFIKSARKSARFLERIRELPKIPINEDMGTQRNGLKPLEDMSKMIIVVNVRNYGNVLRAPSRDFGMDGSAGTWTVHSALKLPPVSIARERRSDASHTPNLTRKLLDGENQSIPVYGNVFNESTANFHQEDAHRDDDDKRLDKSAEDGSFLLSGSGTVIVPSPKQTPYITFSNQSAEKLSSCNFIFALAKIDVLTSQGSFLLSGSGIVVVQSPKQTPYVAFNNQSAKPASKSTSSKDVSISGTVVLRTQHENFDPPRTSKSGLGLQEKSSIAMNEDSANNLAEISGKCSITSRV